MTVSDQILKRARAAVAEARTGTAGYEGFDPQVKGEGAEATDLRAARRALCLWALQYEASSTDADLVAALLDAETAWHRLRPFQGYTDELKLAAFLAAQHPASGLTAQMWRAKTSNFDTWCGFDSRFLLAPGIDRALAEAETIDMNEDLLSMLEELRRADPDRQLTELLDETREYFPEDPAAELPYSWFERARLIDDLDLAYEALQAWRGTEGADRRALAYALASISRHAEAAEVQAEVFNEADGALRDVLVGIRLAEWQRKAGQVPEAIRTLYDCRKYSNQRSDSNGYKRRSIAEEAFLLVLACEGRQASRLFRFADRTASDPGIRQTVEFKDRPNGKERLPLVVLEAAREAARHVGNRRRFTAYEERAQLERERIGQ